MQGAKDERGRELILNFYSPKQQIEDNDCIGVDWLYNAARNWAVYGKNIKSVRIYPML